MGLKLMYITNHPEIAQIAETAGVDRIFVDLEYIKKAERQGGMDTVQSHHTLEDVRRISEAVNKAEILVRINPVYDGTKEEIDTAVANGAEILMLPYFKTVEEVQTFLELVNRSAKTVLLVETPEAVAVIDEILELDMDEIFIGLNDLSLGYGRKFMFELLADGTVEKLCRKFKERGLAYGFGGIAFPGSGQVLAENIITEHYRLGSTRVILSRSFCNVNKISHMGDISSVFMDGVRRIREHEKIVGEHSRFFEENTFQIKKQVEKVLGRIP